jgi:hypothetical protein
MSTLQMVKKEVQFYKTDVSWDPNRLSSQNSFVFPSNVIQCSLSLAGSNFLRYDGDSKVKTVAAGDFMFLGAGITDISIVGVQVTFTAWATLFNKGLAASFSPDETYLTVQAIAECE